MFTKFRTNLSLRIIFAFVLIAGVFQGPPAQAASSVVFGWAKKMGALYYESGKSLAVDGNGNVYMTGFFSSSTVDFDPGPGIYNLTCASSTLNGDAFISKLDADGNFLWAKSIPTADGSIGMDIAVDGAGNVYTVGSFGGTADFDPGSNVYSLSSAGEDDLFISKLSTNGSFLWAKAIGGISYDRAEGLTLDASGNIYLTGYFSDTVDFDPGTGVSNLTSAAYQDIFVAKFDNNGNLTWAKGMPGTGDYDIGIALALDGSGSVYTIGDFQGTVDLDPGAGVYSLSNLSDYYADIFISKLDSSGNFVWGKGLGGTNADKGDDIRVDESGNVFSTGSFNGTADFDPGAGTYNLTSNGYWDNFVSRLDTDGNFVWAKAMGGIYSEGSYALTLDAGGNVYTTGEFVDTVDFDPGTGTYNLTSAGSSDIFISKLDTNGNFVWAQQLPGSGIAGGLDIVVDGARNIYTIGDLFGMTDFDPGTGTYNLSTSGRNDIFVSKLTEPKRIHYVKRDATGKNNGTSWANAYTELKSALAAASSGDEIWVARGTYKPTAGTNRAASFTLKNGVEVYGGFAGTETLRTQRNPATNVTILSGDIGVAGDNSDNSYHVVVSDSTDSSTVLDGFTIKAGNANASYPYDSGGGLYNDGDPILQNLIFTKNQAQYGGGLYNEDNGAPTLTDMTFSNNTTWSGYGGGMYNNNSNPILLNVTFNGNAAISGRGGGMHNENSSPTLTNVIFRNNSDSAMSNFSGSNPTLTNVVFDSNASASVGGGMYNTENSNPTLTAVTFINNSANAYSGGEGGGMMNEFSNPVLTNVTFSGNTATARGAGMYNHSSNPILLNVTFSDNMATFTGGGIYNWMSSPTIVNSIFWGNTTSIENYQSSNPVVTYSVVQGNYMGVGVYPGTGNLNTNPLLGPLQNNGGFTSTMALQAGSSAIDSGDDTNCPAADQRGIARPLDGDNDGNAICDMGAYEAEPIPGVGMYDDADQDWDYSAGWAAKTGTGPYGDTYHRTSIKGSTASFTFRGPAFFNFYYRMGTNYGYFEIWVDGTLLTTINAYSTTTLWQTIYTSPAYADNLVHTVMIKNISPNGKYMDVDALNITLAPLPSGVGIYDDSDPLWLYSPGWTAKLTSAAQDGTIHYTSIKRTTATFVFQAPAQFIFTYRKGPNRGTFKIFVDGVKLTTLNAYSTATVWQKIYISPVYTDTKYHTLVIQNTSPNGTYIDVDAIEIIAP